MTSGFVLGSDWAGSDWNFLLISQTVFAATAATPSCLGDGGEDQDRGIPHHSVVICAFNYPGVRSWAWAPGRGRRWLETSFRRFAGPPSSLIVLARSGGALVLVSDRQVRTGTANPSQTGHNSPWRRWSYSFSVGWFGFNPGSTPRERRVGRNAVHHQPGSSAGAVLASLTSWVLSKSPMFSML